MFDQELDAGGSRYVVYYSLLSAILILPITYALFQMPVGINDMLQETVDVHETGFVQYFSDYLAPYNSFYFRPLEFCFRFVIKWGFSSQPIGHPIVGSVLIFSTCVTLMAVMKPITVLQFFVAGLSLMIFLGHHAFAGSIEYAVLYFPKILLMSLALLCVLSDSRRSGVLLFIIVLFALLTKELGLVVYAFVLTAGILRVSNINLRSWLAVFILGISYIIYRVIVMQYSGGSESYGTDEGGLQASLFNMLSAPLNVILSFPKGGDLSNFPNVIMQPWVYVHLISSLLVVVLILSSAVSSRSSRMISPKRYRVFFILFIAILAALSLVSFFYTRDRHCAVALPFLIFLFYLSVNHLIEVVVTKRSFLCAAGLSLVLMAISVLWGARYIGTQYYIRDLSGKLRTVWIKNTPESLEDTIECGVEGRKLIISYYEYAMSKEAPLEYSDPKWLREWLGGENSVLR